MLGKTIFMVPARFVRLFAILRTVFYALALNLSIQLSNRSNGSITEDKQNVKSLELKWPFPIKEYEAANLLTNVYKGNVIIPIKIK